MTRRTRPLIPPIAAIGLALVTFAAPSGWSQGTDTQQIWNAGSQYPGWSGPSTLELVNGCRADHMFSVTKANADFLDFLFTSPVRVPGKGRVSVPVRFHTNGLRPGEYSGDVTVLCTDCAEQPPCTQDRQHFTPRVTVMARGTVARGNFPMVPTCPRDCSEILKRLNEIAAQIKAQQQVWMAANAAVLDVHRDAKSIEKEIARFTELALKAVGDAKADGPRAYLAELHQAYQNKINKFHELSVKADAERAKLDQLKAQEDAVLKEWQTCQSENGLCQTDDAPRPCSVGNPCTSGWTQCDPGASCYPEICTSEHPCTVGMTAKSALKVTKTKTSCSATREECDRLRRTAEIKEAEARAADQTAADAASEAARQEAAAGKMAGKDPRDIVAQQAIARSARENASTLERAAARIRDQAAAARKAADDCLKRLGDACGGGIAGGRAGRSSGARNCDALRLVWQQAERDAVLAQVAADEAARSQGWNKSDVDYLESQAAKDEAYANDQTTRARAYRELAGTAKGLAVKDREIAARSAPGSKDQVQWSKAAADDEADATKWNTDADAAESMELQYHMRAAAGRAKAAQLRGSLRTEKASADAAKAAAAAAKKAYEDCLKSPR